VQAIALLLLLKFTQHTCQNNIWNRNKVSGCHEIAVAARFDDLIYHPEQTDSLAASAALGPCLI